MSERARLTMGATLTDEEFQRKIAELKQEMVDLTHQAQETDQTIGNTQSNAALMVQDVAMLTELALDMVGMGLSAGGKAAISMIATGAMAYRHVAALYATNPILAPLAATMYAASFAMQINALREVNEQTEQAMKSLKVARFAAAITLRY